MLDLIAFERPTAPVAWSAVEIARLFHLRLELGWDWPRVARALGRTESGVKSKLKYELFRRSVQRPAVPFEREPVPESVLAEQAKRIVAPFRDLAGAVFGDPPVGCSMLDRRLSKIS